MSTDGQPQLHTEGWRRLAYYYLGVTLLTLVRSRAQGDSKECRTRPAPKKTPCKRKVQSFEQTLKKAQKVLAGAAEGRVLKGVGDKRIVQSWTGRELDKALDDGHVVHTERELAHMTPASIRRLCVRELLKNGTLVKFGRHGRTYYKLASEALAQAS